MPFHRAETFESMVSGVSATSTEIADMQNSRIAFESAETVEQLQDMTTAFLRGELSATSYHMGTVLSECAPLIEKLVALNKTGFITTGSQPGGTEMLQGSRVEKRFYVEGILQRRYLALFLQAMYVRCGESCFIAPLDTEHSFEEICHLQSADLYWLRRIGKQGIYHIPEVTGPCQMFQTCDEIYPQLVDEYVSIVVMDTRWGHKGTEILDAMHATMVQLTRPVQMSKFL